MAEAGEDAEESLVKPLSPLNRKHTVTTEPDVEPVTAISYPGAASSYLSSSRGALIR
jgi:hypothetical protein